MRSDQVSVLADLRGSLLLVIRAKFASVAVGLLFALLVVVLVAAEFSARQPATVALDVGLSFVRLVLPIFAILLVQELMAKEFDRRLYLTSFTYPRARSRWLFGRLIAVALCVYCLLLVMALLLAGLAIYASGAYAQATPISLQFPYLVTLFFIAVDLLVVLAIATLMAVTTTTPSFVLIGTVGFVLIARTYMPILQLLQDGDYLVEKIADPKLYKDSLSALNFVLPDLGTLDVRMISLYNKMEFLPGHWAALLFGALAYAAALFSLAVWRLNVRQFQ
jgi:Cu-processing system permease protein